MVNTNTLSELSQLGKQLNSDSNSINTAIEALNGQLREMNLGVEAWVLMLDSGFKKESGFQERKYSRTLGFSRIEDQWQLTIDVGTHDYELDPNNRPAERDLFKTVTRRC